MSCQGNMGVSGSIIVGTNVMASQVSVSQCLSVSGSATVVGDLYTQGLLSTTANATIGGTLSTTGNVTFGGILSTTGNATIGGTLTATTLSGSVFNPYWIAGQIGADGVTVSKRNGRYSFTSQLATSTQFLVSMSTPHPPGADYIVLLTAQGDLGRVYVGTAITSTQFRINWGSTASPVFVAVVAPLPY